MFNFVFNADFIAEVEKVLPVHGEELAQAFDVVMTAGFLLGFIVCFVSCFFVTLAFGYLRSMRVRRGVKDRRVRYLK